MNEGNGAFETDRFDEQDTAGCRIETQGGTVYWISEADSAGLRWVIREHLQCSETNTMVLQTSPEPETVDLGDKFRACLSGDVEVGRPFCLEVVERKTRILSEPVVAIETGNVPSMLFG